MMPLRMLNLRVSNKYFLMLCGHIILLYLDVVDIEELFYGEFRRVGNMLNNVYALCMQSFIVGRVGKPKGKMFTSCVIFIKYSFTSLGVEWHHCFGKISWDPMLCCTQLLVWIYQLSVKFYITFQLTIKFLRSNI